MNKGNSFKVGSQNLIMSGEGKKKKFDHVVSRIFTFHIKLLFPIPPQTLDLFLVAL